MIARVLLCATVLTACGSTPTPQVPAWQLELDQLRHAHFVERDLDPSGQRQLMKLLDAEGEPAQADLVAAELGDPADERWLRNWLWGRPLNESAPTRLEWGQLAEGTASGSGQAWLSAADSASGVEAAEAWLATEPRNVSARVALAYSLVQEGPAPAALARARTVLRPVLERYPDHPRAHEILARAAQRAAVPGLALESFTRAGLNPPEGPAGETPTQAPRIPVLGPPVAPPVADLLAAYQAWVAPRDLIDAFNADTVILCRGRRLFAAAPERGFEEELRLLKTPAALAADLGDPAARLVGEVPEGWVTLRRRARAPRAPFHFADPHHPVFRAEVVRPAGGDPPPAVGAPSPEVVSSAELHVLQAEEPEVAPQAASPAEKTLVRYLGGPRAPVPDVPFAPAWAQRAGALWPPDVAPEPLESWAIAVRLAPDGDQLTGTASITGPSAPPAAFLAPVASGPWTGSGPWSRPLAVPVSWHAGHGLTPPLLAGVETPTRSLAAYLDAARAPNREARVQVPETRVQLTVEIGFPPGWRPDLTWDSFDLQGHGGASSQTVTVEGSRVVLRRETRLMFQVVDAGSDTAFARFAADVIARTSGTYRFSRAR